MRSPARPGPACRSRRASGRREMSAGAGRRGRGQTHEAGIHRADVESAAGVASPYAAAVAADGIDELIRGFASRRGGRLRSERPRTLEVHAADAGDRWLVRVGPDGVDRVATEVGE